MQISDAEAQVMEVLWSATGPLGSEEIAQCLQHSQEWQLATVKTLLNRLLNKGAVGAEKDGRRYRYSPLLKRTDWVAEQSTGLLDRLFDGSLAPLVAQFAARRRLKAADVAALKQLLQDYEDAEGTPPRPTGRKG